MGEQVVRLETAAAIPALVDHALGTSRPPEAIARGGVSYKRLYDGREVAERTPAGCRGGASRAGSPGAAGRPGVVAGPPPYESEDRWSENKVTDWSRASTEWFVRRFEGAGGVVHSVTLHTDERSPHLHVVGVPVVAGEDAPRFSWSVVRRKMAEAAAGKPVSDHRQQMSVLQDDYYHEVGAKFRLGRGVKGSKKRHQDPDRRRGLEERVRDAEARAREAEAQATEHVKKIRADAKVLIDEANRNRGAPELSRRSGRRTARSGRRGGGLVVRRRGGPPSGPCSRRVWRVRGTSRRTAEREVRRERSDRALDALADRRR